ncbi:MAG TPA: DUF692 domain-containing protein [Byssovorax sp.]|jgi:hypothetical protein
MASKIAGVGLGLRWEFLDDVLGRLDGGHEVGVPFFELAPENHMRRGGHISHAVDRIAEAVPLVTHGLTLDVGGLEPIDDAYLDELTRFVRRVRSPFHSDHLCFGGVGGAVLHDLLPLPFTREAAANAARRAREVEARVGLPLLLENITHYFVPGAPEMSEAAFIREVLDASGARLLLDVNNAWVNAQNYGFDARAFLLDLPLDRVAQIHVAGHVASPDEGVLVDSHGADCVDPVLELLAWTVERTGPVPVVLERDHAVPEYEALLAELARVSAAVDVGLTRRGRSSSRSGEARP